MEGGVDLKVGLWLSTRVKKDNNLIKALFAYMLIHVIFCKHPCIRKNNNNNENKRNRSQRCTELYMYLFIGHLYFCLVL